MGTLDKGSAAELRPQVPPPPLFLLSKAAPDLRKPEGLREDKKRVSIGKCSGTL